MSEETFPQPLIRNIPGAGVLRAIGAEFPDLLHRISTNVAVDLQPGDVRETILTTEKGRIIDVVLVVTLDGEWIVCTSPGKSAEVLAWLRKYTIMEDIDYRDDTDSYVQYEINRLPMSDYPRLFPNESIPDIWKWTSTARDGSVVLVFPHASILAPGIRVLAGAHCANDTWHDLGTRLGEISGIVSEGDSFEVWRIRHRYPMVGKELTSRVNPLEAGAEAAVSFTKGCYIGQEVIARLDSYNKVQRHLKPLEFLSHPAHGIESGTALTANGSDAGFVTSSAFDEGVGKWIGLGCVRLLFESVGTVLDVLIDEEKYQAVVTE